MSHDSTKNSDGERVNLRMAIPDGIPELAKDRTSRDVKSGGVKVSFSKSEDQGSLGIMDGAASTSLLKARVRSLLTLNWFE